MSCGRGRTPIQAPARPATPTSPLRRRGRPSPRNEEPTSEARRLPGRQGQGSHLPGSRFLCPPSLEDTLSPLHSPLLPTPLEWVHKGDLTAAGGCSAGAGRRAPGTRSRAATWLQQGAPARRPRGLIRCRGASWANSPALSTAQRVFSAMTLLCICILLTCYLWHWHH